MSAVSDEIVEKAAAGMYGKNWNGSEDKRPGEKMKEVWRRYAKNSVSAVLPDLVKAETEACAKICDERARTQSLLRCASREAEAVYVAAAIRARHTKEKEAET